MKGDQKVGRTRGSHLIKARCLGVRGGKRKVVGRTKKSPFPLPGVGPESPQSSHELSREGEAHITGQKREQTRPYQQL